MQNAKRGGASLRNYIREGFAKGNTFYPPIGFDVTKGEIELLSPLLGEMWATPTERTVVFLFHLQ